jgi:hypothetical protein
MRNPWGAKRLAEAMVYTESTFKRLIASMMPNPFIELTCLGKPGHAVHVKR